MERVKSMHHAWCDESGRETCDDKERACPSGVNRASFFVFPPLTPQFTAIPPSFLLFPLQGFTGPSTASSPCSRRTGSMSCWRRTSTTALRYARSQPTHQPTTSPTHPFQPTNQSTNQRSNQSINHQHHCSSLPFLQGEGKIVGRDFVVDYQGDSAPEAVTEPAPADGKEVRGEGAA